jgi:2-oxoglutarate ferredoxin oxidoreductase subunit beta
MAPTTLEGQKTTTSQAGRDKKIHGENFKMAELIATMDAPKFVARVALHDAKNAINAKKTIKKALERQVEGKGYSFIEIISMCPTNWKMTPVNCVKYIDETVLKEYPLGVLKEE